VHPYRVLKAKPRPLGRGLGAILLLLKEDIAQGYARPEKAV